MENERKSTIISYIKNSIKLFLVNNEDLFIETFSIKDYFDITRHGEKSAVLPNMIRVIPTIAKIYNTNILHVIGLSRDARPIEKDWDITCEDFISLIESTELPEHEKRALSCAIGYYYEKAC